MTNEEVNEYMHRYLDDDLSDDEAELLMEHLRQSPATSAMFERLKRLHSDLEQLPRVTPPISIVDSILPRLEREGLWSDPTVSNTEQTATSVNKARTAAPERGSKTGRQRIHYKWLGGVVAAGIALAVFITTFGPGTSVDDSADDSSLQRAEALSSANDGNSSFENAKASEEPMAKDSAAEDAADGVGAGMAADGMSAEESAPAKAKAETVEESAVTLTSDQPKAAEADQPKAQETDQQQSEEPANTAYTTTPESTSRDEPVASKTEEAPVADKAVPSKDKTGKGELNRSFGFVPESEPIPVTAPDGASSAKAVDMNGSGQVIVTDQKGNTIYKSAVYQGTLLNLQWSENSTKLTFDVATDGEIRLVTIDLTKQTESVTK